MPRADLSISGLATGFDWKSVVTQLANAQRSPELVWQRNQARINGKNTAFDRIKTFLNTLQTDVKALKDPKLYGSRTAGTSDAAVASATAAANATNGTFSFNISQIATAARINGTSNVGKPISATGNLNAVTVADAGFASAVTPGNFTINGKQVAIAGTDTLQQVLDNIATATANGVTGSYSAATDKFTLTSANGSEIILGSAADTSNFFQVTQMFNNQSGTITSRNALGRVNTGTGIYNAAPQLATAVASGFGTPVTAGTFTVNGTQVTIGAADSLQTVLNSIASATSNAVTARYNGEADKLILTSTVSGDPITLGDAGDTSNFLQAMQLASSTTGTSTSAAALGGVHARETLNGLATQITDGGTGQGGFKINGVLINYNSGLDSIDGILDRINNSTAGVTASYDTQNNRFNLANKITGDLGIALEEVTGNFLAATGLAGGALTHGQNLNYTLNGGTQTLVSQTNTINQDSSNLTGLSVNALTTGTVKITVGNDNTKVTAALQNFIKDYNTVQTYISTQTASSTDSTGKVTAGILAADQDANGLIKNLRSLSFSPVTGLSGTLTQLASLGIKTNGKDNTIELSDTTALDTALSNLPDQVRNLFTDANNGVANQLDKYLSNTIGDSGTLTNHMASLTRQITSIDGQIASLEKTVAADSLQWTKSFQAMETAQARITQQLSYLTQAINKGSL